MKTSASFIKQSDDDDEGIHNMHVGFMFSHECIIENQSLAENSCSGSL